jgi:hypothetical protein
MNRLSKHAELSCSFLLYWTYKITYCFRISPCVSIKVIRNCIYYLISTGEIVSCGDESNFYSAILPVTVILADSLGNFSQTLQTTYSKIVYKGSHHCLFPNPLKLIINKYSIIRGCNTIWKSKYINVMRIYFFNTTIKLTLMFHVCFSFWISH